MVYSKYGEVWFKLSPISHATCTCICRELLRSMGEAGEIEPETESFLIENDIDFEEFSPEALDCLPKQAPWTIPQVPVSQCSSSTSSSSFSVFYMSYIHVEYVSLRTVFSPFQRVCNFEECIK